MASSGKKGKKTKGRTVALNDFLQETPGITPTIPIRKSNTNWADEVEDNFDSFEIRQKANVVLPTAPKSARGFDEVSERIPHQPPYNAYITNLPYDVREEEIIEFFRDLKIANMRIPREERPGEPPRLKGYGYVEFEDRDSLIGALSIADCSLKNRRIRIEVADNLDNDRKRSGRMDNNRDRPDRSEITSGDWRVGPRVDPPEMSRNRTSGFNRERDNAPADRDKGGSWRDNRERSNLKDVDRDRDRGRDGFGDRGRFSDKDGERRGFGPRRGDDRDFSRGFGRDDSGPDRSEPRTRPTIVLQQRTIPLNSDGVQNGSQDTTNSVPTSSSIFGNAKPVDTSIKERQIEEWLAKQSERSANERDRKRDSDRRDWGKRDNDTTWSRDRRKESPRRDSPIRRGSPTHRNDQSPNRGRNYDQKSDSLGRRYSPEGRRRSPEMRRRSPEMRRRSPELRRESPDRHRKSPEYRANSPIRKTSPEYSRNSLDRSRYSPDSRGVSPDRKAGSIIRRRSPKGSPELRRRASPEPFGRRDSPEHRRASPERKGRSPDRSQSSRANQRKPDDRDKKGPPKSEKSQKNDRDKKKEDKSTRENHEREMPKMREPEAPNFVASNKYAFLPEED